jgi:ectoine hydroxylase-related dioxygenase (phytanoyl-CoA dioxygenase family)
MCRAKCGARVLSEHVRSDFSGIVRTFQRAGHVRLDAFFQADEINKLADALVQARADRVPAADDDSFSPNVFLSRSSAYVSRFVTDPRLGELAAELLGCRRIRFMQDVVHEIPDKQHTPWHRDSDFWSFSGAGALTIWIPLQDTPLTMSPLRYATGSHVVMNPRPLRPLQMASIPLRFRVSASPLRLGDVGVHHYLTLHGADRNHAAGKPRRALSIHLIDADALVRTARFPRQARHSARCGWDRIPDGGRFTDEIAPLI